MSEKFLQKKSILGKQGEVLIKEYLEERGFSICATNYSCRQGELDIVAEKHNLRLFVEVKTRTNHYFELSQVITLVKQNRIIAAAHHYNAVFGWGDTLTHRFDVALLEKDNQQFKLTYIPNAFAPQDGGANP